VEYQFEKKLNNIVLIWHNSKLNTIFYKSRDLNMSPFEITTSNKVKPQTSFFSPKETNIYLMPCFPIVIFYMSCFETTLSINCTIFLEKFIAV
jgi:hypothetical protein